MGWRRLATAVGAAVVGLGSLTTISSAIADTGGQATAYQIDAAHDGYQPDPGLAFPLTKQWSTTFSGPVSYPVVVGGLVYVTVGNTLWAYNLNTGAMRAAWGLGGTQPASGPTYDNGLIYGSSSAGDVEALTPGNTLWSTDLSAQSQFSGPPTAAGGQVFISGSGTGGDVFALSGLTGALQWSGSVASGDASSPAIGGGGVYAAYACDQDYDFDPATGDLNWDNTAACADTGGSTPVFGDGKLYGVDQAGGNVILNAATGAYEGTFAGSTTPALANHVLYTVSGGELQAVNDDGLGATAWTFAGDGGLDTPPLVAGSTVFVGSSTGELYAVSAADGTQLWSTAVGNAITGGSGPFDTTGMAVADQALVVPAGNTLTVYSDGEPSMSPTTTGVVSDADPAYAQTPTTLDTWVGTFSGTGTVSGSVSYDVNGASIPGCQSLPLTGAYEPSAVCPSPALPVGTDIISATYSGDGSNYPSVGWLKLQVKPGVLPTTTVGVSSSTSYYGGLVTATATVTGSDGGGSVAFTDNGSSMGCSSVALTGAGPDYTAVCTTRWLPIGGNLITATYSGDGSSSSSSGSTNVLVTSAPDFVWDGASDSPGWTSGANWLGGSAPTTAAQMLTFPNLPASTCSAPSSAGPVCYQAYDNDIAGLQVGGIMVDSDASYLIGGDQILLGAQGLSVDTDSGLDDPPVFGFPITLDQPQSWNIDEGPVPFVDAIAGSEPLTLKLSNGSIEPVSGMEVGPITASGVGGLYLDGDTQVNSSDSAPVSVSADAGLEADDIDNSVGPLTVGSGGWLSVGGVDDGGGSLTVDGNLQTDPGGEVDLAVDAPGTTAGTTYSAVTATGPVNLGGATLYVNQGTDASGDCDDLKPGDTLTLISAPDITGTFSNLPTSGSPVDITDTCNGADRDATGTLTYSSTAVTLTITGGGDAGDVPVETGAPALSGTPEEGQTLAMSPGSWQGAISLTYSWWECTDASCSAIPGATSSTFVPTSDELGYQIIGEVTASDAQGSNTDTTDLTAEVFAEPLPVVSAGPTISGATTAGSVLSANTGTWSNSPTGFSYQWLRCTSNGLSCSAIGNATTAQYNLTAADVGSRTEVQVSASNYGGSSAPAHSAPTAVISSSSPASDSPGGSGPGTAKSREPSRAQIRADLTKLMLLKGSQGTLAQVIRRDGYMYRFPAPSAGRLTIKWTPAVSPGSITIAHMTVVVSTASSVGFKLTLTAPGRRYLRSHPSSKVLVVASFKPSNGEPMTVSSDLKPVRSSVRRPTFRRHLSLKPSASNGLTRLLGSRPARRRNCAYNSPPAVGSLRTSICDSEQAGSGQSSASNNVIEPSPPTRIASRRRR